MNRAKWCFAGVTAGLLALAAPALGDVSGVFNSLVNGKSPADTFAGTWQGPAGSDIDHLVVSTTSAGLVRIQVFGRCETRVCNWGALPARIRTDGPVSETIRSLSADFNLGFALRHITLHRAPGNALRFDMVTEFTDGSERHDYESAGQLVPAGTAVASVAPQAANQAPETAAPSAAPTTSAAPVAPAAPIASPPPVASPPSGAGGGITALNPLSWFGSKPSTPAPSSAAAVPSGPVPEDNSIPVAASTAMPVDDCITIDTGHLYIASAGGNWNLRDFLHVAQSFGPYKLAAAKGLAVVQFYRFDEVCHVGRGSTNLTFFRTAGEVARQPMGGQDCTDVHPERVVAVNKDDDWKVMDGDREIFNYGSDREGAAQAAAVVKSLNLSRQCYFDRANVATSYWLSR